MKLTNIYLMGVVVTMIFSARDASSKPFNEYLKLSDNRVESENYEIRKLIHGPIWGVFYLKETNTVLVQTEDYLWKINDRGYVVDTLERQVGMHSSGLSLHDDYFIDWVYSGIKSRQHYPGIIDAKDIPDGMLFDYLDAADIIEFRTSRVSGDTAKCYLWNKGRMTVLDVSSRYDRIDTRCHKFGNGKGFEDIGWDETCLDGYAHNGKNKLALLTGSYISDWQDSSQPLFIQKFARRFTYFEEGVFGWVVGNILGRTILSDLPGRPPKSYGYGRGYFQLSHHAEQLNFRALASTEDKQPEAENISLYKFPEDTKSDIAILGVAYPRYRDALKKHYEKEVGLYVVRKKSRHAHAAGVSEPVEHIHSGKQQTYRSRNGWQPVFTGMPSRNAVSGNIDFYNSDIESSYYRLDPVVVAEQLHAIPEKITFNWDGEKNTDSAFRLSMNDNPVSWHDLHGRDADISLQLHFDEAEIVAAFQKLDTNKQPLQLDLHMEEADKTSASFSVSLRNGKETVLLKRTRLLSAKPAYSADEKKQTQRFEKSKLTIEYNRAMQDINVIQDFFDVSGYIALHSPYIKDYETHMSYYSVKLLFECVKKHEADIAEKILHHYVDRILPYTGASENTISLANYALVVALLEGKEDLNALVFEKLLGPDFDISRQTDGVFLFNLSCYYAVHKEKPLLLKTIKQALQHGKSREEFMADKDFHDYWEDADFLSALAADSHANTNSGTGHD